MRQVCVRRGSEQGQDYTWLQKTLERKRGIDALMETESGEGGLQQGDFMSCPTMVFLPRCLCWVLLRADGARLWWSR